MYVVLHNLDDIVSISNSEHDFNFSSTVFVSALIFITLVTTIIITILIVMLTRVKGNNKKILEQLSQAKGDAVYEEIVCKTPPGSPSVDIDKNVAYDQAMKTTVMT